MSTVFVRFGIFGFSLPAYLLLSLWFWVAGFAGWLVGIYLVSALILWVVALLMTRASPKSDLEIDVDALIFLGLFGPVGLIVVILLIAFS